MADDGLLTVYEVAALLGVRPRTVEILVQRHKLRAADGRGQAARFTREAVERYRRKRIENLRRR